MCPQAGKQSCEDRDSIRNGGGVGVSSRTEDVAANGGQFGNDVMAATKFQPNYKKEEELDLLCITSKANRTEIEENFTDDRCLLKISIF